MNAPVRRVAGRVIVQDPAGAVLLCRAAVDDASWWFTPGGGTDGDETTRGAAIRELAEETSIDLGLPDPPVLHRRARFTFLGRQIAQVESFWWVRLDDRPVVATRHLEDYEAASLQEWRWVAPDHLEDLWPLYPAVLSDLLTSMATHGRPQVPWVEEHLDEASGGDAVTWQPQDPTQLPAWVPPAVPGGGRPERAWTT